MASLHQGLKIAVSGTRGYDWPTLRAALLLAPLTMTRLGDVRHVRRWEIIFPKAMWRIADLDLLALASRYMLSIDKYIQPFVENSREVDLHNAVRFSCFQCSTQQGAVVKISKYT